MDDPHECSWYFTRHGFRHDIYVNPSGILIKWRFGGKHILWKDVLSVSFLDDIVIRTVDGECSIPNLGGLEDYIREMKYIRKEKTPLNGNRTRWKTSSEKETCSEQTGSSFEKGGSEWLQ